MTRTEQEIREWYGIQPTAVLPRSAIEIHGLSMRLYAAWRSFESGRSIEPHDAFAPAQFFHVATELCSLAKRGNFHTAEHILWPQTPEGSMAAARNVVDGLAKAVLTSEQYAALHPAPFTEEQKATGQFVVRLYDGMDNQWTDVSKALPYAVAEKLWLSMTEQGTKNIDYDEIDYYRIFPADTKMVFSGGFGER